MASGVPLPFFTGGNMGSSSGNGGFGALYHHNPNDSQDAQSQMQASQRGQIQHHTPFGGPRSQFPATGAIQPQRYNWEAQGMPQHMSTPAPQPFQNIRGGGFGTAQTQSERPMLGMGEGNMPVVGAIGNVRITRDPQGETEWRFLTTDNVSYPDKASACARQAMIERGAPSYMIEEQCPPPSVALARRLNGK